MVSAGHVGGSGIVSAWQACPKNGKSDTTFPTYCFHISHPDGISSLSSHLSTNVASEYQILN